MDLTRRDLLKMTGAALAATTVAATPFGAHADESKAPSLGEVTTHKLPALTYAFNALEPVIDAKTMELHYSKHHQAYVDGLNKAEGELAKARGANDFGLIEYWSKKAAFHGGGHFLHSLFWRTMAPVGSAERAPGGDLAKRITRDFGSLMAFKAQFAAAAKAVEGGGWAILAVRRSDERLIVLQVENQQKLSPWDSTPILGIDVWEHAYYLKYQNRRAEYVDAWWSVVNWEQVDKELKQA